MQFLLLLLLLLLDLPATLVSTGLPNPPASPPPLAGPELLTFILLLLAFTNKAEDFEEKLKNMR